MSPKQASKIQKKTRKDTQGIMLKLGCNRGKVRAPPPTSVHTQWQPNARR